MNLEDQFVPSGQPPTPGPPQVLEDDRGFEVRRLTRLVLEAFEVAFTLCNLHLSHFGLSKIMDIINQLLPSAYVLNSSYWPLYSSESGECICICARFGLHCSHIRSSLHWINMESLPQADECYFFTYSSCRIIPVDCKVSVDPIIVDTLRGYEIGILLAVRPEASEGLKTNLLIETRHLVTPEYLPYHETVVHFSPHPNQQAQYGRFFQSLRNPESIASLVCVRTPKSHTIISSAIPNFTIIPQHTTYPVFRNLPQTSLCQQRIHQNVSQPDPPYLFESSDPYVGDEPLIASSSIDGQFTFDSSELRPRGAPRGRRANSGVTRRTGSVRGYARSRQSTYQQNSINGPIANIEHQTLDNNVSKSPGPIQSLLHTETGLKTILQCSTPSVISMQAPDSTHSGLDTTSITDTPHASSTTNFQTPNYNQEFPPLPSSSNSMENSNPENNAPRRTPQATSTSSVGNATVRPPFIVGGIDYSEYVDQIFEVLDNDIRRNDESRSKNE